MFHCFAFAVFDMRTVSPRDSVMLIFAPADSVVVVVNLNNLYVKNFSSLKNIQSYLQHAITTVHISDCKPMVQLNMGFIQISASYLAICTVKCVSYLTTN